MYNKALDRLQALPVEQKRLIQGRYSATVTIMQTLVEAEGIRLRPLAVECYCALGAILPATRAYDNSIDTLLGEHSAIRQELILSGMTMPEALALQVVNDWFSVNGEDPLASRFAFVAGFMRYMIAHNDLITLEKIADDEDLAPYFEALKQLPESEARSYVTY